MLTPVKIVPSVLRKQVEEGMKLKPLAEHYGLPVTQMKKALKSLDLQIRKFHAPKFEFEEEVESTSTEIEEVPFEEEDVSFEEESALAVEEVKEKEEEKPTPVGW